jgi:hypothetical protein
MKNFEILPEIFRLNKSILEDVKDFDITYMEIFNELENKGWGELRTIDYQFFRSVGMFCGPNEYITFLHLSDISRREILEVIANYLKMDIDTVYLYLEDSESGKEIKSFDGIVSDSGIETTTENIDGMIMKDVIYKRNLYPNPKDFFPTFDTVFYETCNEKGFSGLIVTEKGMERRINLFLEPDDTFRVRHDATIPKGTIDRIFELAYFGIDLKYLKKED